MNNIELTFKNYINQYSPDLTSILDENLKSGEEFSPYVFVGDIASHINKMSDEEIKNLANFLNEITKIGEPYETIIQVGFFELSYLFTSQIDILKQYLNKKCLDLFNNSQL